MENFLIISDVHHKTAKADRILKEFSADYDKVIFLGDFQDDWNDDEKLAKKTAKWTKEKLEDPKNIFILSNHDQAYRWPYNDFLKCSGWTPQKSVAVNSVLTHEDWAKFKLFHYENGYYFTHAGLSPYIFGHPINGFTPEIIEKQCQEALDKAEGGMCTWYLMAGQARGGLQDYGGCTWLDFDMEFVPVPNANQCCGHTPRQEPECKIGENSINWCIDCHLNYVGIIEGGKFRTEKFND